MMLNSIWTNDLTMPTFSRLEQDITTDTLIIGGGLAGILCAHALTQDGVDCVLIEADRICHGVSRNTTAKITSQHGLIYDKLIREFDADTARLYWEANEAALREYHLLSQSIDCDFETKDSFVYSADNDPALGKELAALRQLGLPGEFADKLDLPFPVTGAIRFPDQAQFHPLKFAVGIAGGLRIYEHTAAREFLGNQVTTDGGKITAKKIIVATHFPILNKHGGYFLKMYQQRSYVLALEGAEASEGMFLGASEDGYSFRKSGDLLLLGGGGHRTGKQGDGWTTLEALAAQYYPTARIHSRWATQDCMTLDGIPYIGQYSRATPDLFVATGFNKWGITSSMVAAMILRDLTQGKDNPYASIFRPSRTVLRPQLLCNAMESVAGLLTFSGPRCPHMGCALQWNSQERSWDCPCHGSRFTEQGKLLDNPATGDLNNRSK